jgi:hypothetical protein
MLTTAAFASIKVIILVKLINKSIVTNATNRDIVTPLHNAHDAIEQDATSSPN